MSSYVIPVFPAASRVPPRDALSARLAELSSELAAIASAVASVSGKADKAPPAAAGSLASLDASGNLLDSGATPASIKAAAVAEVVANAPGTMDTLKEIADLLGSAQQAGTVLKRISDLESGKVDKEAGKGLFSGSYGDLTGRPAIPSVDASLATPGAAADAKAVGDALRSGFTEWEVSGPAYDPSKSYRFVVVPSGDYYDYFLYEDSELVAQYDTQTDPEPLHLEFLVSGRGALVCDRRLVTPTKTSQLANDSGFIAQHQQLTPIYSFSEWTVLRDGVDVTSQVQQPVWADSLDALRWLVGVLSTDVTDGPTSGAGGNDPSSVSLSWTAFVIPGGESVQYTATRTITGIVGYTLGTQAGKPLQPRLTANQLNAVNSGATAAKVAAWDGYAAQIAQKANTSDVNQALAQKASLSDLPYRLVEPGGWEFSGEGYDPTNYDYKMNFLQMEGSDYWQLARKAKGASEWVGEALYGGALQNDTEVDFSEVGTDITAMRASLPGHLLDRAVNAVSATGATTLTLPALVNAGKSRDLLVRLTVSADAAVTFSAPAGETMTWDDAGSPTATYEAGTHLLRFTEVAPSVFHFADLGDGGSIDPAVLNGKLEATSAAPAFDPTKTYSVGEYVTYNGVLYECSTAVTTAGAWTGLTNWTATDMTSPDATLDLMADGRLRLVSANGEVLWMQGYGLASASSVTLSCDKVNFHAFAAAPAFDATAAYAANDVVAYDGVVYVFTAAHAAGAWTGSDASVYAVALAMPTAPSGKVGDFVLDVDNTANASASVTATLTGAGTAFDVFTPEGVNLSTDILTFAGGERCELYFTMTAFGTAAKPAWKVVKQVVEKQEFGS